MDTNLTQLKCDSSQNNWLGFVVFFGFNTFIFISLCCVISLSSEEIVWLVFKAIITCPFPFYFLVFSQMIVKMAQNGQFDRLERFGMPLAICFPVSASLQYYQTSESLPSLSLAHYCNLLIGKGVNITIWPRKWTFA